MVEGRMRAEDGGGENELAVWSAVEYPAPLLAPTPAVGQEVRTVLS